MTTDYITAEVKTLIGVFTDWVEAPHPVEASEVRRLIQGGMEPRPKPLKVAGEEATDLAPAGFVVHMFRQPLSDPADPLDRPGDSDFDGAARQLRSDLPPVPIPLPRVVNGGYDHEFYSHVRIGERVLRRTRYRDIYQRAGKSGPMVFVVIEDEYKTVDGRPLQRSSNTQIMR